MKTTTNTKTCTLPLACMPQRDEQETMKKRKQAYKHYLFISLFLLLSPMLALHAQTPPKTGDLVCGGIVVNYNADTDDLLIMSLDEIIGNWNDVRVWANNYKKDGYTDWHLPTQDELGLINTKKDALNAFLSASPLSASVYWSGSENSGGITRAWFVSFSNGSVSSSSKGNSSHARAVRAFKFTDLTILLSHSQAVVGASNNATVTNTLSVNNKAGNGKIMADYRGGTIRYSAGTEKPIGENNTTVSASDFVGFAARNYLLASHSPLIAKGSGSEVTQNGYKTAINGIRRIVNQKIDIGAYQTQGSLRTSGNLTVRSKTYDEKTDATYDATGLTLIGIDAGYSVSLDPSGIIARFANGDAGANKKVNISGTFKLSGADASSYTLTQPDVSNIRGTITKAAQTISFDKEQLAGKTTDDVSLTLVASSTSKLAVSFASDKPEIASITNDVLHIHQKGEVSITASQAGNNNYEAAADVSHAMNIAAGTITSIEEQKLRMQLVAYPNPVQQHKVLMLDAAIDAVYLEGATISIYNSMGTLVRSTNASGRFTPLEMSVDAGFYLLKLKGSKGFEAMLKIIVQ